MGALDCPRPAGYLAIADALPVLHGRMNPLNAYVAYFSGALLAEAGGQLSLLIQWWTIVLLAAIVSTATRFAWFRRARVAIEPLRSSLGEFVHTERGAWLDVHVSLQGLVLAGVCAQPAALFVVPLLITFRVLWALPRVQSSPAAHFFKRIGISISAPFGALSLLFFAGQASVGAMQKAAAAGFARWQACVGFVIAIASAYLLYIAPSLLLARESARELRGTSTMSEEASRKLAEEQQPHVKARKRKDAIFFTVASSAAVAISPLVGNEFPVVAVFALQLARLSPSRLLDVLINKGNRPGAVDSGKTPRVVRVQERAAWIARWRGRRAQEVSERSIETERESFASGNGSVSPSASEPDRTEPLVQAG